MFNAEIDDIGYLTVYTNTIGYRIIRITGFYERIDDITNKSLFDIL
jgi:hypothetical protein